MIGEQQGFFQPADEAAQEPPEQSTSDSGDLLDADGDELDVGGDSLEVGNDFLGVGDDWIEVD